jgi:histone H3/H4
MKIVLLKNAEMAKEEFFMAEVLVVTSKLKDAIKAQGCNTAGDAVEAVSAKVSKMVAEAAERAKANGRKTVRGVDF